MICRVELDFELKNYNVGQTRHWGSTVEPKRLAVAAIQATGQRHAFAEPVAIRVIRCWGKRQRAIDFDSILRGNCKSLIDAFVSCGWLVDDSPKYVLQVVGDQVKSDDGRRKTIVEFYRKPASFAE